MSRRYKSTGCLRLIVILLLLAPLTYIGASYINGEDGIENFKRLIRFDQWGSSDPSNDSDNNEVYRLEERIKDLEKENKALEKEVKYYKDKLESLDSSQ